MINERILLMKQIYVHGLGQSANVWKQTIEEMDIKDNYESINLVELLQGKEATYSNLYSAFVAVCNENMESISLCGLSLGGVLSLNYAVDYPERVKALVLIAAQYKMPKRLLQFQNALFRIMPKAMFRTMGFDKCDFIQLCKTMSELDFSQSLSLIKCPVLVICGEKDKANQKAALHLADKLENAEFRMIPNAGHEINKEAPKELSKEIRVFYHNIFRRWR